MKYRGGSYPGEGKIVGGLHNTHTEEQPAMDKIYEQQFKRAKGDAAASGEEEKTGEKGSWGSLTPALSDSPSTNGGKKTKGPPVPFTLRRVTGLKGRHAFTIFTGPDKSDKHTHFVPCVAL